MVPSRSWVTLRTSFPDLLFMGILQTAVHARHEDSTPLQGCTSHNIGRMCLKQGMLSVNVRLAQETCHTRTVASHSLSVTSTLEAGLAARSKRTVALGRNLMADLT